MVSKASDDLPEPLSPVITVSVLRGISTEIFFKLCWRAPRTVMLLIAMGPLPTWFGAAADTSAKHKGTDTVRSRRVNTQLYSVSYCWHTRAVNFRLQLSN